MGTNSRSLRGGMERRTKVSGIKMLTVKVDNGRITRYIVGALLFLSVYLSYI